ncbi:MAG: hypothetical protein JNL58_19885 [Planctomyces sp.]|nr:hypothetical protein [Planctomyces sp.]
MSPVVPPSLLFQFTQLIPRISELPRRKGDLLQLPPAAELFVPARLNDQQAPLQIRCGWNEQGLGIDLRVKGRKHPAAGRSTAVTSSDRVLLSFDTRHTAGVHRITSWCTSLLVLPQDEDNQGTAQIRLKEFGQPKDSFGLPTPGSRVQFDQAPDGYRLQLWIPAAAMAGYAEVPEIGRMGIYCVVEDTELGTLPLNVSGDFPISLDPSTWLSIELAR